MSTTDTPTGVYAAFADAMSEIGAVGKDSRNEQGWMFRGIDAVMNVVGPVFRKHGLFLIPEVLDHTLVTTPRGNKSPVISVIVKVRYTVAHVDGSSFSGVTPGEGNDFSDKATAKAMSVALRTFLIQSLVLPTHDEDPDAVSIERGGGQPARPEPIPIPDDWADYVRQAEDTGDLNTLIQMQNQADSAAHTQASKAIAQAIGRVKRAKAAASAPAADASPAPGGDPLTPDTYET